MSATKYAEELRAEHLRDQWFDEHHDDLEAFADHLAKYPFVGLAHPMGKNILESLDRFPASAINEGIWYRARPLKDGADPPLEAFRNPNPATTIIGEGRYNHYGQSVLYLAETEHAAVDEVIDERERRAWVCTVQIKGVRRILDLGFDENWADEDLPLLASFSRRFSSRPAGIIPFAPVHANGHSIVFQRPEFS
jgi:hypothetical protein